MSQKPSLLTTPQYVPGALTSDNKIRLTPKIFISSLLYDEYRVKIIVEHIATSIADKIKSNNLTLYESLNDKALDVFEMLKKSRPHSGEDTKRYDETSKIFLEELF